MTDTGDEDERLTYIYTSIEENAPHGNKRKVVNVRGKNLTEAKKLYEFADKKAKL